MFVGGFISTRNADGRRTGAMERFQTVVRRVPRYVFVLGTIVLVRVSYVN